MFLRLTHLNLDGIALKQIVSLADPSSGSMARVPWPDQVPARPNQESHFQGSVLGHASTPLPVLTV
jgi:hypothetical protein